MSGNHRPTPPPCNGYTLSEGLTRLAAQDLGLDPDLAAAVGDDARAALNLLRRARDASDSDTQASLLDSVAHELRTVDPRRHGRFLAQVDQVMGEIAGTGQAAIDPTTGAQEFAVWDGLKRLFGAGAGSVPDQAADGLEPLTIRGRRSTEQLQPLVDPIPITGQPRLETLKLGKAPVLSRKLERERSILSNSPATFDISPNQAADASEDLHELGPVDKFIDA
jgi:hypothetical protein